MLKKIGSIVFIITTLLVSLQANAGFREALSALQHNGLIEAAMQMPS